MVRRSIPLGRRLRAIRGKIFLALVWSAAAMTCAVLLLVRTPSADGVAVAVTRTHLVRAPDSGRLASIDVAPMQRVEAGTVLGRIEVPGLAQRIAAAEASLAGLDAQLGAEDADRGRKFARDLEDARGAWLSARVELEREQAILSGLDVEYARVQTPGALAAGGEVDRARSARDAARATVGALLAEVAALNTSYDAARVRAGGLENPTLKSAVEAAAVELEGLRILAESNVLRAQAAGVVTAPVGRQGRDGRVEVLDESFPAPGQWLQAGVAVLMVTEPGTQDAVLFVGTARAHTLVPGTIVSVRGEAGSRYDATVQSIGVAVEPVPLRQQRDPAMPEWGVPVIVEVTNQMLTPGEALSVEF